MKKYMSRDRKMIDVETYIRGRRGICLDIQFCDIEGTY